MPKSLFSQLGWDVSFCLKVIYESAKELTRQKSAVAIWAQRSNFGRGGERVEWRRATKNMREQIRDTFARSSKPTCKAAAGLTELSFGAVS